MGRVKPSGKPTAPSKDKRKSKIFLTKRQRGYVPVQYPQPPRHLRPPHAPNTPRHAIFPPGLPNPLPGTNPRVNDPDLLQRLSLSWTEAEAQAFQRSIPTYHSNIRQGRNLYPAVEEWLVESERAKARLKRYYEIVSIADHRRKKYETMVILDPTRFNRVIEADENLQVRDARTGRLELVVLRDFVGDLDVLAEMDAAVKEQVDIAYDVRLEDPGSMPLYGYSAGLLNRRMLSWGCNVLRLTIPDRVLSLHQHALCSTQAILWAIMRKKLPAEIITEVESGLAGLPRMDWNMKGQPITPIVSTKSRGQDHEIHDLEMGPPGGVCTNLYSRRCHREDARRHPWALSLTTKHSANATDREGSFYSSEYGILVRKAPNTVIAHRPGSLHGTAAWDIDYEGNDVPEGEEPVVHRGITMETSDALNLAYSNYLAANGRTAAGASTSGSGSGNKSGSGPVVIDLEEDNDESEAVQMEEVEMPDADAVDLVSEDEVVDLLEEKEKSERLEEEIQSMEIEVVDLTQE